MIEYSLNVERRSGNGIPYAAKLKFKFTDDKIEEDECSFLINKIKEYANNLKWTFDYYPTCIGTHKPKKKFITVFAIKLDPNVTTEECKKIMKEFKKVFVPQFIEFYETQRNCWKM